MTFSPWAILAIVLTGISVAGLYGLHRWRSSVDMRAALAAKEASDNNNDKASPPSDLGESGEGPGPGPGYAPTAAAAAGPNMVQPPQQYQPQMQQQYQPPMQQQYQQQQMSQQDMRLPTLPPPSASSRPSSGERTFVDEERQQQGRI